VADLLEIKLAEMIREKKDEILKQLRESKGTDFKAALFSWNTVIYRETLQEVKLRESDLTREQLLDAVIKRNERRATIEANNWESTFGVKHTTYNSYYGDEDEFWTHYPKKIDQIFRCTDLAMRLSLILGPSFFPFTALEQIEGAGEEGDQGFGVYKKTLYARFYPFGLSKAQMTKLLATARKDAERKATGTKMGYGAGERAILSEHLPAPAPAETASDDEMPPLVSDPRCWTCTCGCEEDADTGY
jgi:hypothetical protein